MRVKFYIFVVTFSSIHYNYVSQTKDKANTFDMLMILSMPFFENRNELVDNVLQQLESHTVHALFLYSYLKCVDAHISNHVCIYTSDSLV